MGSYDQLSKKSVFRQLKRHEVSLKEQPIVFNIELYDESSAYYLAARLQKEHWDVHVIASDSVWICLANAIVMPDDQTIGDLCDYLSDLSDNYGGQFQKWELGSTI